MSHPLKPAPKEKTKELPTYWAADHRRTELKRRAQREQKASGDAREAKNTDQGDNQAASKHQHTTPFRSSHQARSRATGN
jgi:hypothetical protein